MSYDDQATGGDTGPLKLADRHDVASRQELDRLNGNKPGERGADRVGKGFTGGRVSDTVGRGFTGARGTTSPQMAVAQRFAAAFLGNRTRRRNTLAGSLIGLVLAGFGIYSFFGISGFEFIQFAKLIEHAHLGHNEDLGNRRTGKLFAYLRSGGDVGETRLNWLERKYKNVMLQQLDDVGFKPNYGRATTFQGLTIDTTNKNSPYYRMKEADIKASLADSGITDKIVTFSRANGGLVVTAKGGFLGSYFKKTILNKFLVKQMNESVIPDAVRMRILAKYGAINWHPLNALKSVINTKINAAALAAWEKARDTFLTTGQDTTTLDTSKAGIKDKNGNVTSTPGESGPVDSNKASDILNSIKDSGGLSIAGGVAAAVGILCILYTIDHNYGFIHYVQYVAPTMRLAAEILTIHSQIQNGTDVDTQELGYVQKNFVDSTTGQSWVGSKAIAADSGQPGGVDLNQDQKDAFNSTPPSWLNWIARIPGIGGLCSTVGSVIVGAVGVVIGVFSGETATTVIGAALSALVLPHVISYVSNLVAGHTVDILKVSGPALGTIADYGARLLGNGQAVFSGGVKMTPAQESQINTTQTGLDMQEFRTKNLAYRLFSPTDAHSLLARVMDTQGPNLVENLRHMANGFLNIGHYLASMPLNFISGTAFAGPIVQYQYPFPMFSWSDSDVNNPLVQDPYDTTRVSYLLDNNGQNGEPDFIGKVAQCFNDAIVKTPESDGKSYWDVIEGVSSDPNSLNLYDSTTYNADDCIHPQGFNQDDWLRMRAFVANTGTMEGYVCEHGDTTSCLNSGWQ